MGQQQPSLGTAGPTVAVAAPTTMGPKMAGMVVVVAAGPMAVVAALTTTMREIGLENA